MSTINPLGDKKFESNVSPEVKQSSSTLKISNMVKTGTYFGVGAVVTMYGPKSLRSMIKFTKQTAMWSKGVKFKKTVTSYGEKGVEKFKSKYSDCKFTQKFSCTTLNAKGILNSFKNKSFPVFIKNLKNLKDVTLETNFAKKVIEKVPAEKLQSAVEKAVLGSFYAYVVNVIALDKGENITKEVIEHVTVKTKEIDNNLTNTIKKYKNKENKTNERLLELAEKIGNAPEHKREELEQKYKTVLTWFDDTYTQNLRSLTSLHSNLKESIENFQKDPDSLNQDKEYLKNNLKQKFANEGISLLQSFVKNSLLGLSMSCGLQIASDAILDPSFKKTEIIDTIAKDLEQKHKEREKTQKEDILFEKEEKIPVSPDYAKFESTKTYTLDLTQMTSRVVKAALGKDTILGQTVGKLIGSSSKEIANTYLFGSTDTETKIEDLITKPIEGSVKFISNQIDWESELLDSHIEELTKLIESSIKENDTYQIEKEIP